jgi:hypothetical protein
MLKKKRKEIDRKNYNRILILHEKRIEDITSKEINEELELSMDSDIKEHIAKEFLFSKKFDELWDNAKPPKNAKELINEMLNWNYDKKYKALMRLRMLYATNPL